MSLIHRTRPAEGEPEGMLVLLHGRGADEHDLYPLLDALDPERRLLGVTPRGPLSLPPGGAHWYALAGLGTPDPSTFDPTYEQASHWLDRLAAETGIPPGRTVLGGFSQGAVMTHALGEGADRPRPAGLITLSGFIPTVDGWEMGDVTGLPVAIGHGTYDPVIGVQFGRSARERLEQAGAEVTFHESPMAHSVDPAYLDELRGWVSARVGTAA
jgi:phospholipase/carboxylesterase